MFRSIWFVFPDHARGDEDDQFLFLLGTERASKQPFADIRNIAQPRDLFFVFDFLGLDEAAQDDGAAVVDADNGRGLLGVEDGSGGAAAGRLFFADEAAENGGDVQGNVIVLGNLGSYRKDRAD